MTVESINFVDDDTGRAIRVPRWVKDYRSFCRWSDATDGKDRLTYCNGKIWVETAGDDLYTHNAVKAEVNSTLYALVKTSRAGRYFHDGAQLRHAGTGLSCVPDGIFVSRASFDSGRVVESSSTDGRRSRDLTGSPDMVLEVVSRSSVVKDTLDLRDSYYRAGVTEFWLIDARFTGVAFELLRPTARGYRAVRPRDGWLKSEVFGVSFRLDRVSDDRGRPEFNLTTRS